MPQEGRNAETVIVKADRPWYRVHSYLLGAAQYNPNATGDSRFSPLFLDPTTVAGSLYCGHDSHTAFCETIFRNILDDPNHNQVLYTGELRENNLSLIKPKRDLRLLDLRHVDGWPEALEAVRTVDYTVSRRFGRAMMGDIALPDGLIWHSRLAPGREACVLFDHRFAQIHWEAVPPSVNWQGTYSLGSEEGLCLVGTSLQKLEQERGIVVDLVGTLAPGR